MTSQLCIERTVRNLTSETSEISILFLSVERGRMADVNAQCRMMVGRMSILKEDMFTLMRHHH